MFVSQRHGNYFLLLKIKSDPYIQAIMMLCIANNSNNVTALSYIIIMSTTINTIYSSHKVYA